MRQFKEVKSSIPNWSPQGHKWRLRKRLLEEKADIERLTESAQKRVWKKQGICAKKWICNGI